MFTMLGSLAVREQPEDSTLGFALSEMSKKQKNKKTVGQLKVWRWIKGRKVAAAVSAQ